MTKKIPWEKIQKRYLSGEKPATIAADYGITSKTIRDKAHRGKWGAVKATICDEIATEVRQQVIAEKTDALTLASQIRLKHLINIDRHADESAATRQRGEGIADPYHLDTYKQTLKTLNKIEEEAAKRAPSGEKPGFNIVMPADAPES